MRVKEFNHGARNYGYEEKEYTVENLEDIVKTKILPKVKLLKDGRRSIALSEILSEVESSFAVEYICSYLSDGFNVIVRGTNSTIDGINNYEYISTYRNLKAQKLKALSKGENFVLFKEYEKLPEGYEKAQLKNRIIAGNLPLVPYFLWKMSYSNKIPLEELCSYGNEGLMKAVEMYNYKLGNAFSTYAFHYIYFYALDGILTDYAHLSRNETSLYYDIADAMELLREMGVNEEDVSPKEIIKIIETVRGQFLPKKREWLISNIAINSPLYVPNEFLDKYENKEELWENVCYAFLKKELAEVLKTLTEREKEVLNLRFGLMDGHAMKLEEVAVIFNTTRERVRQIEAKALRKLRHPSRSKRLKNFLN